MTDSQEIDDAETDIQTGLPIIGTWKSAYIFVAVCFVSYVVLLIMLEGTFK
jgi:hypothetical protein